MTEREIVSEVVVDLDLEFVTVVVRVVSRVVGFGDFVKETVFDIDGVIERVFGLLVAIVLGERVYDREVV